MAKLTCTADKQNFVDRISTALGVKLPECSDVVLTETGGVYASAGSSYKIKDYGDRYIIDTVSVDSAKEVLTVHHCIAYHFPTGKDAEKSPSCKFSWERKSFTNPQGLERARGVILREDIVNQVLEIRKNQTSGSLLQGVVEVVSGTSHRNLSPIGENIQNILDSLSSYISNPASVGGDKELDKSAIRAARTALEDHYRSFKPDSDGLTSLLHLYLAKIIPTDQKTVEQVLKKRTKVEPLSRRYPHHVVLTPWSPEGKEEGEHNGQVGKLLHFMIEDGIITKDIRISTLNNKTVQLKDLALGYTRYLELTARRCSSSSLEAAAWNLINFTNLSSKTDVFPLLDAPFKLGDALEDIYSQLLMLHAPSTAIPYCGKISTGMATLNGWQTELLPHTTMMYGAYLKANPQLDSIERMRTLYGILIEKLKETIKSDPENLQKLGHDLEAIGRTLRIFPEIDYVNDKSLLIQAVNQSARELAKHSNAPIETTTHVLLGIEILEKLLTSK